MGSVGLNLGIGVVSAIFAVVLMQAWPPRYRWSKEISWTVDGEYGRATHRVKLGRRKRWIWKRRGSPIDVTFRARVGVRGIGPSPGTEKIVAIPVDKEWRPVIASAVFVNLLPEQCDARDLRHFPVEIRTKRADGTLDLNDLLRVGNAELRVYVFAYRPRVGTRWMRRQKYTLDAIQPGVFKGLKVLAPGDGKPPVRPDLRSRDELSTELGTRHQPASTHTTSSVLPAASVAVGRWTFEIRRHS